MSGFLSWNTPVVMVMTMPVMMMRWVGWPTVIWAVRIVWIAVRIYGVAVEGVSAMPKDKENSFTHADNYLAVGFRGWSLEQLHIGQELRRIKMIWCRIAN